jgi:hypothetical protein
VAERQWFKTGHEQAIFEQIMAGLAARHGEEKTVMIEVSMRWPCVRVSVRKYLTAHPLS